MRCVTTIGQDSHRFISSGDKTLVLGGYTIPGELGLDGNSDADVVLHALTNAISGLTGTPILGAAADRLCAAGTTDSKAYLELALTDLATQNRWQLTFISCSIQAKKPKLLHHLPAIRQSIANLVNLPLTDVTITCTTGEGLTGMGRGEGMECICLLSAREK